MDEYECANRDIKLESKIELQLKIKNQNGDMCAQGHVNEESNLGRGYMRHSQSEGIEQ